MKTIANIIAMNGDLEALQRGDQILVKKGSNHPDILIAYGGVGLHGGAVIRVSQLIPGVGEILVNPEMFFEVRKNGVWYPYYRRDDTLPIVSEAFVLRVHQDNPDMMGYDVELQRGLISLALEWDRKLGNLGYDRAPVEIKFFPLAAEREEVSAAYAYG